MHILIAPNAFKNALKAADVAERISDGLKKSRLRCSIHCFPVGDGGDGTAELIVKHCNGSIIKTIVSDPLGRKINSSFGLIDNGETAVIEMANASGLRLLSSNELNPLHANSYGTGELILHALDKKVNKIILCIGGSATVDGAVGILQALGTRFLDKSGKEIKDIPGSLTELDSINVSSTDQRLMQCELIVLCDVENFLLGEEGAAAVFGPQKGASAGDVKKLEASLSRLRDIILNQSGKDIATIRHGGAAGGTAAGLATLLNAQLVKGADYFLSLTGFDNALKEADVVITGEGSIDLQTLQGKGPYEVAKRAKEKACLPVGQGKRVIGLAGKVPATIPQELKKYFDELISINHETTAISEAITNTGINLVRVSKDIGDNLSKEK
jgi:glycerate kinase